jgi:citronellol/citronellal dehydrogenase
MGRRRSASEHHRPWVYRIQRLDTYDSKDTDFIRNKVASEIPLQRFGTEAEVSAAVVFLLSPAASFITGTCIRSTAEHPTPSRGGGTCNPSNTTSPSTGSTAPHCPQSSTPIRRTSRRGRS